MSNNILQLDEKSVDEFCHLRIELLEELCEIHKGRDITELKSAINKYYMSHINKDLLCWGVFQERQLVSIGSLCLFSRIPYEENYSGLEGYILNIYTLPVYRKRGFAS